MLRAVSIKNFRALRNLSVELRPLNVLIGPNDTGKSSFLQALDYLFSGGDISPSDHWGGNTDDPIEIIGHTDQHELALKRQAGSQHPGSSGSQYHVALDGVALPAEKRPQAPFALWTAPSDFVVTSERSTPGRIRQLFRGGARIFRLPRDGPSTHSRGEPDLSGPPELGDRAEGLATFLDYLLRADRKRYDEFVQTFTALVPGLADVTIRVPEATTRQLYFTQDGLAFPGGSVSAGTRLLLFFVALSFHPSPPEVILLEEPDNGFHPRRLAEVMSILRAVSKGSHGGAPAQVVLTTHSPYLVDQVNLDEDQVLVFRRNDDGSRTAEPVDAQRLKAFVDDFMLGEVWFNEKEEGLIRRGE